MDKVRDVVGLSMNPPERALVLCVDERPRILAVEGTAPVLPLRPGQPERRTHDDKRNGTTDLFAGLNIKTGTVVGTCKARHRATAFRAFLDQVEAAVPADLDVHLVLDNAATHKTSLVHDWLIKRPRWHLHVTPTSASRLNMVEGWFALLSRKQIKRGVFKSTDQLEAAIQAYIDHANANPKPFCWTKSADVILASVSRFRRKTSDPHQPALLQLNLEPCLSSRTSRR